MEQAVWQLEWNEDLSVGIPEIDREHQGFVVLVNGLNRAIADHMGLAEVRKRMQAILDDWEKHHAHEEELFRRWHYPDAGEHAQRHAQVTAQLRAIMAGFDHGSLEYEWIAAGLKVKQALIDHLLHEDTKYRDYYRSMPHDRDWHDA